MKFGNRESVPVSIAQRFSKVAKCQTLRLNCFGSFTVSVPKYSFARNKTNPKISSEIRYNRLNH